MSVTITAAALATAAGISTEQATRLLPVATALVTREVNNTSCPESILNEACIRVAGWLEDKPDHTAKQTIDMITLEHDLRFHGCMRLSGARSLLAPWRRHRTTTIRATDARETE